MDFSEKKKLLFKFSKLVIFVQVFSDSAFWFHSATTRKLISLYKVISVSADKNFSKSSVTIEFQTFDF